MVPLRRAFTLIELIVVIVMIAIMASVIVPAYGRFYAKSKFEQAAQQVQDIFSYAREQAITRDTTVTVRYDSSRHAFTAQIAPPLQTQTQADLPVALSGKVNADGTAMQSGETERSARLNDETTVTSFSVGSNPTNTQTTGSSAPGSGNQLHFQSDGTVENATLELAGADGANVAKYQLWPASGRISRVDPQQ